MWIANNCDEVLDCGGGEKLERWGNQILQRPDPRVFGSAQRKIGCGAVPVAYGRVLGRRKVGNPPFARAVGDFYKELSLSAQADGI